MPDLVSGGYPPVNPNWLLNGSRQVSQAFRESLQRSLVALDSGYLVSGVMSNIAVALQAGDVVNYITFVSGGTAAGTPTHCFFALYSAAGNLIAQTADQGSAAWAADTALKLALETPYVATQDEVVYAAICVNATTVPSIVCGISPRAAFNGSPIAGQVARSQTSGSALTTTAPATIASPTTVTEVPYCVLSTN